MVEIEKATIAEGQIEIPRMINGLWQLAGGHDQNVEITTATQAMESLISVGLSCFDMADHYGDAELIIGEHNRIKGGDSHITAFTKWCPQENGITTFEQAEAAVNLALKRMNQDSIQLMQYHAWDYTDPSYLCNLTHLATMQKQGKIAAIGVTNMDAAHLELLLHSGYDIATNQVSCSVIDRRVGRGRLSQLCAESDVAILAYGTLLGGYLSEKWLGAPEPEDHGVLNWSLRKYLRFIKAAGGWEPFQVVLQALSIVAKKHQVSIAAVATRWVLDIPVVKSVIVGTRLSTTSEKHVAGNLSAFAFMLDEEDHRIISTAQERLSDIPGDCGDEYRRRPFLTAKGDLSDHIDDSSDAGKKLAAAISSGSRIEYRSGSKWESIAGYCRAMRTGKDIRISGTTANPPAQLASQMKSIGGNCARCQTTAVIDIMGRSLKALGGTLSDVVRTRIFVQDERDVEAISLAHGWAFQCVGIRPANTLVIAGVIGAEMLVEIEAEAVVDSGNDIVVIE